MNKKLLILVSFIFLCSSKDGPVYQGFISGDGFKYLAKHREDIFVKHAYQMTHVGPWLVKDNDIVFVKPDRLEAFFKNCYKAIKHKFILITHNSDEPIPNKWATYLDDPKIIAWLGTNPDIIHPKLIGLPSGLSNLSLIANRENEEKIIEARRTTIKKDIFLYINFESDTNLNTRPQILETFKDKDFVHQAKRKSFCDYLLDLAKSEFVLSPPGCGLDCHRTWEALYMGAIPIVLTSTLDPIFKDLPVLIVDSWDQVTKDFLIQTKAEFSKRKFNMEKLYMPYWQNLITSLRGKNE